jgi:uncharacterized protein (TIGR02284 family)
MAKEINDYLNDILQFLYNSADCYESNMENISDDNLKQLFGYLSQQRYQMIDEIKNEILELAGEPKKSRTLIGKAHEFYENLKNMMTDSDPLTITKEIKHGKNMLIECYKEALKNDFPEKIRSLLLSHLDQIGDELKRVDMSTVTNNNLNGFL